MEGVTNPKEDEVDRKSIVVVPVWVLKRMLADYQEYEKRSLSLGRRREANEQRGRWKAIETIVNDPLWLERGREMLAELAAARIKPPCHHVWYDMTMEEDRLKGMKRKVCHVCNEEVLEAKT